MIQRTMNRFGTTRIILNMFSVICWLVYDVIFRSSCLDDVGRDSSALEVLSQAKPIRRDAGSS